MERSRAGMLSRVHSACSHGDRKVHEPARACYKLRTSYITSDERNFSSQACALQGRVLSPSASASWPSCSLAVIMRQALQSVLDNETILQSS